MITKGYYQTTYRGSTITIEKMEGDWWIDIDGQGGYEPRVQRWMAIKVAKAVVDSSKNTGSHLECAS